MNTRPVAALIVSTLSLAGCTALLEGEIGAPAVVESPPIVSDRFLLESGEQSVVGTVQVIAARAEDTFVDIARAYNLGYDELLQANPGIDPWLPGEGSNIVLPTRFILPDAPRDGIVINLASKRLFFFPPPDADGQRAVVTFPIGIGKQGFATPTGTTTVTSRGRDPVWWVPASIRREYAAQGNPLPQKVMPGPDNPLGRHVLVLGMPSYLIHGTNRPAGVGMRVSHGCVRLFPENIEYLFDEAPDGVAVHIVNQPVRAAWDADELLLEMHPPLEDDTRDIRELLSAELDAALEGVPGASANPQRVDELVAAADGIPAPVFAAGRAVDMLALDEPIRVVNLVELPDFEPEDGDALLSQNDSR